MTLTARLRAALGALIHPGTAPATNAADLKEAIGVTIDQDEDQWRRLTGDSRRDLSPMTHRRMQDLALHLWETNLLANRLVELPLAYLLAEGVTLTADDAEVQGWLDSFWHDPINCMDIKLAKKVRELALFGEQCWPVFVNEVSGHLRLGYLDPASIETVVADPDNAEQPIGVVTTKDQHGRARRYRVIVNGPESVFAVGTRELRAGFSDGDCFYYKINDLSNGHRGRSDLLAQIDWLDGYDEFLFGELDRAGFMRAFLWDVTLKGATPDDVKARASKIQAPRAGSVRVHNDSEEWAAVTPDLKAVDSEAGARLFRNHILGGGTLPEHWYGGGGDVNRSTAAEMGDPTFKNFAMRQRVLKHILEDVGAYVVQRRLDPSGDNLLGPEDFDPALKPVAVFPELVSRDVTKFTSALREATVAAGLALDRGLISEQRAVELIAVIAGHLGIEIDPADELEAARLDAARRAEADMIVVPDAPPAAGNGAADGVAG